MNGENFRLYPSAAAAVVAATSNLKIVTFLARNYYLFHLSDRVALHFIHTISFWNHSHRMVWHSCTHIHTHNPMKTKKNNTESISLVCFFCFRIVCVLAFWWLCRQLDDFGAFFGKINTQLKIVSDIHRFLSTFFSHLAQWWPSSSFGWVVSFALSVARICSRWFALQMRNNKVESICEPNTCSFNIHIAPDEQAEGNKVANGDVEWETEKKDEGKKKAAVIDSFCMNFIFTLSSVTHTERERARDNGGRWVEVVVVVGVVAKAKTMRKDRVVKFFCCREIRFTLLALTYSNSRSLARSVAIVNKKTFSYVNFTCSRDGCWIIKLPFCLSYCDTLSG